MKIPSYLSLLITFISFSTYSQIIEEKKEGDIIIKNYLNNDLEIIKIEKIKESRIIESYEYLPGGKIKNGKFFNIIDGSGTYENDKVKEGTVFYYADIPNLSGAYFFCNLNISDFKIKGEVELLYDFRKKGYISEREKKTTTLASLNFNENGLLDGKQFYDDTKYIYYLEYKNGNPIKYVKKDNETFVDSITFNKDITKNVTYLLDRNVYNREQPRLIFNPFNFFIRLNDDCYNQTINNSNYEDIPNSGYSNNLKQISLNYNINADCENRKTILEGINVVFDLNSVNFIDKISKSDYSFLPVRLQDKTPKKDIASIEYLFISEILLGRNKHEILGNNYGTFGTVSTGKRYDNNNYLLHYYLRKNTDSEHSILSNFIFRLTTTGFPINYGLINYDTRQEYSESITENINLFKDISYYFNSDLFYKINFENSDLVEIKKITDLMEKHSKVFKYFNTLTNVILDKINPDLLVIKEDETEEVDINNEKNKKFYQIKKGKPNKYEIITFLKSVSNDTLISTDTDKQ
ncbi:hypothetical protein [Flavobacterium sp. IMCC34518]|uniref:hypothetical protein n=1 Tax=Flavobacterium sp. IMCC34518 TaxID=3003623 RepID=UPI00248316AE|nr:hypothetical protein [Flavobacterium sp. IMCC34518]